MGRRHWLAWKWLTIEQVAKSAAMIGGDLSQGFINGGVSAGGNLALAATYKACKNGLSPPLTGSYYLFTGMPHEGVDSKGNSIDFFSGKLVSWYALADAPFSSKATNEDYLKLARADVSSNSFTPFHERDHSIVPPVYYQVAGVDLWRDSAMMYAELLREASVRVKMDVYPGTTHCWWASFPEISITQKWKQDLAAGVQWLLNQEHQLTKARL
jgi:acetyl esterase/lipase